MPKRMFAALGALASLLTMSCDADKLTQPPKPTPPNSAAELVDQLASAYHDRDDPRFAALLASESGTPYMFLLDQPDYGGETQWGVDEELRIHRRMFDPQHPVPGDLPVPHDLWIAAITINLTPIGSFVERHDLGLDPTRWKANEAIYRTHVLWDLAGPTDYLVDARAGFTVLEDLAKNAGEPGKFTLYRWQDLERSYPDPTLAGAARSWGNVKELFR